MVDDCGVTRFWMDFLEKRGPNCPRPDLKYFKKPVAQDFPFAIFAAPFPRNPGEADSITCGTDN
jgi:hypothetical protein